MLTDPPGRSRDDTPLIDRAFDDIHAYDHPVPAWWKWIFIGTIAFGALFLPYHHLGAPGRSVDERYDEALSRNMRLQFAEIGDLQPNEPTLVRMMHDRRWVRVGESVYRAHCASCHGLDGGGIVGPNLTDDHYKNVRTIEDILRVVQQGAAGGAMPGWKNRLQLNEQILVSSYVASLRGTTPSNPRGFEGNVIPPWPDLSEVTETEPEDDVEAAPDAVAPDAVAPDAVAPDAAAVDQPEVSDGTQ